MIGQKAALMTANMLFGTILGLVAVMVVTRFFEPAEVGAFSGALGILGLLYFMTDLGMGSAHVKRVSEGRDPGDCFATFTAFKLVSTLVFVLVVAGGAWFYLLVLGKPLVSISLPILGIALAYYVAKSLAEIGQSSFDARLETAKSQSAQLADTIIRVILTIWFALILAAVVHRVPWAGWVPTIPWVAENPDLAYAVTFLAGAAAAAAVSLTLLVRTLERGRFRWELLKDYASFALPLFIGNAIGLISVNVDAAVLSFFRDASDTGIFAAVRRLPLVLQGFGTALSALLFPAVSAMVARGDQAGVQRTTDGALRWISLLLVPTVAFAVAFPYDLIRIVMDEKWLAGGPALAILCVWVLLSIFGHVHSFLLLGFGRSDLVAKAGIAAAVVLIVLNLALVPDDIRSLGIPLAGLGVTGAAIATLASGIVWYGGVRMATRRIAGFRERGHALKHVAAGIVMAVVLLALDATLLPLVRWYHIGVLALIGGLVYFAILRAWGEITNEDIALLKRVVHPGEMLRYVKGEIGRRRE